MDDMILSINNAITRKYHEIIKNENVFSEIENVFRQIRFEYPELAIHVKKQMIKKLGKDKPQEAYRKEVRG